MIDPHYIALRPGEDAPYWKTSDIEQDDRPGDKVKHDPGAVLRDNDIGKKD